jgi:hypothetical protein
MIDRVSRCAPNTDDAIFTAAAFRIVFRAIHLSPGMRSTHLDAPTLPLGVTQRLFYVLVGMILPVDHALFQGFEASLVQPIWSCQLTTRLIGAAWPAIGLLQCVGCNKQSALHHVEGEAAPSVGIPTMSKVKWPRFQHETNINGFQTGANIERPGRSSTRCNALLYCPGRLFDPVQCASLIAPYLNLAHRSAGLYPPNR